MSLNNLTADQINIIKSRLRNEMNRRRSYGSLEAYGKQSYEFSFIPVVDKNITTDQGIKTINPLLEVCDLGDLIKVVMDDVLPYTFDVNDLNAMITQLSSEPMAGTQSSCRSACSGLCIGTCGNKCSGCTNQCTNSCTSCGMCTSACVSSCSSCGGCAGQCTGCNGTCTGCSSSCKGNCMGCSSGCGGGCEGGCTTTCNGVCAYSGSSL